MKKTCKCDFCKLSRRIDKVKAGRSLKAMRSMIDELALLYLDTSDDRDYQRVILDGSWPTAVEQLEAALVRAKERRQTVTEEGR
jgi:hypothetical protein